MAFFFDVGNGSQEIFAREQGLVYDILFDMIFLEMKVYKGVIAVAMLRKSVIFLIPTYIYGKTRTKFENLKTSSCSAHHSSSRFVNN